MCPVLLGLGGCLDSQCAKSGSFAKHRQPLVVGRFQHLYLLFLADITTENDVAVLWRSVWILGAHKRRYASTDAARVINPHCFALPDSRWFVCVKERLSLFLQIIVLF